VYKGSTNYAAAHTLNDLDGSEVLGAVVIGGMPAAATLNAGINNGNGTWTLTAAELAGLTLTAPNDGVLNLSVTATSSELSNTSTASANTTFQADIQNLAPTLAVLAPTAGVRGQRLAFTLNPTDPSVVDQALYFTYDIDWNGDGTIDESLLGLAGTVVSHIFPAVGVFNTRITAFDADGAPSNLVNSLVTITVVGLQTDPIDPTKTALAIGGTTLNDVITFRKGNTPGSVTPVLNGVAQGTFTPTGRLLAFGQKGHDNIKANKKINLPVWFDGGEGDDTLTGGPGADILQGQAGNDDIKGGDGRDLIIGGLGLDDAKGGVGDDLLIAGSTVYDANDAALGLIQREWTSARTYTTRIQNLRGIDNAAFAARVNAQVFLITAVTVEDDNQFDALTGNTELDWFFADLAQDKLSDVLPAELAIAI
jgi:Ca2+-binding RTX toxin-like protein